MLLHALAAMGLITISLPRAVQTHYRATALYLPPPPTAVTRAKITMPRKSRRLAVIPELAHAGPAVGLPRVEPPAVNAPVPPTLPAVRLALPEVLPPSRPEVRTGQFESRSPAANAPAAAPKIQTAGFDSVASESLKPARSLGSSAGFGAATTAQSTHEAERRLESTQFDAAASAPAARRPVRTAGPGGAIEIISKPKPVYTEEARRLRIEGEVVLEVLFRASAQVCVLRVLHSLGHGLDESATRAATGIRFHPASDSGRAVDSVATVKIEFQLAD